MKKRLLEGMRPHLSLLLTAALVMGLLPLPAMAADRQKPQEGVSDATQPNVTFPMPESPVSVTADGQEKSDGLSSIEISKFPDQTDYTEGEALDLTGLVITLAYADGNRLDVEPVDFIAKGITTSPAHGAKLTRTDTFITVSLGGVSNTFPIQVTKPEATITGILISPQNVSVQKGTNQAFAVSVVGLNRRTGDADIIWRMDGNTSSQTRIIGTKLIVAADEEADVITLTATSNVDNSISGTATVTVTDTPPDPIYAIEVVPAHLDLGTAREDYNRYSIFSLVDLVNTGNRTLKVDGLDNSKSFKWGSLDRNVIAVGEKLAARIELVDYLPAGTYRGTLAISPPNSQRAEFTCSFTVEPAVTTPTYTVSFDSQGGSAVSAITGVAPGATVDLPTPTRSGYRFDGWFTEASGGTLFTGATPLVWNLTLYAHWSSSGGGGGRGRGVVKPPQQTSEDQGQPAQGVVKPAAQVGQDGKVEVVVTDQNIQDAIDQAMRQAQKNPAGGGIAVTIDLTDLNAAFNSLPLTLSKTAYDKLVKAGVKQLAITTPQISLSLDLEVLRTIAAAADGDVTIQASLQDVSRLPAELQGRPAYDLTVTTGGKTVSRFGGMVAVTLPYTPQSDRQKDSLRLAWVDDQGRVQTVVGSGYDGAQGAVTGETDHFTVFGIAAATPNFTDVKGHWAESDILFVASCGLLSGTSATTFSPDDIMTRGMAVTALYQLAGSPQAAGEGGIFTDVPENAYYAAAVAWAASKGIVRGVTDTSFAPDCPVTRQQLAVIMAGYARAMGCQLPAVQPPVTFADADAIESWAADAVQTIQRAGVMGGKEGNRFDPAGTATRAQIAAVLRQFVELVDEKH